VDFHPGFDAIVPESTHAALHARDKLGGAASHLIAARDFTTANGTTLAEEDCRQLTSLHADFHAREDNS
jgi:hypothetical protein